MSAQETVPGQKISSSLFAESITENPPRDVFAGSLLSVPVPCRSTDASQPWNHEKHYTQKTCMKEATHFHGLRKKKILGGGSLGSIQINAKSQWGIMHLREQARVVYLHKAIMEEQAKELPRDGRVHVRSWSDCVSDHELSRRAWSWVETQCELITRSRSS